MEEKDRIIMNLKQENQMLKKENHVMRNELMKFSGVNLNNLLHNNNNNYNQMSNQNFNNNNQMNQIHMFPNTQENIFNKNWSNPNQNPIFLPPIQPNNFTPNNNNNRQNGFHIDTSNSGKKSTPYSLQENLMSQPNQWFMNNNGNNNNMNNNGYNNMNNNMNNNNNNNNFNPNRNFYRNDSSNMLDTPQNNSSSLLQENLKLKEKISNLENAFLGGNTTLLPDKSKFSREDFFSEKDDKEDNTIVIKLFFIYKYFSY